MEAVKILCLLPSLPEDLDSRCIPAIENQTVPVCKILVFTKRYSGGILASRVSRALNDGLKEAKVNVADYDYILRLDGQTILPRNFVEYGLKRNCDLFGESVHAALIKVKAFQKLMNSQFHPETDEVYLTHKFAMLASTCTDYGTLAIRHAENEARHSSSDHVGTGILLYKAGYEPLHMLATLVKLDWRHLRWLQGYIIALIERRAKWDFADLLWNYQVRRLIYKFGQTFLYFFP